MLTQTKKAHSLKSDWQILFKALTYNNNIYIKESIY